jgi:hypothetical protein
MALVGQFAALAASDGQAKSQTLRDSHESVSTRTARQVMPRPAATGQAVCAKFPAAIAVLSAIVHTMIPFRIAFHRGTSIRQPGKLVYVEAREPVRATIVLCFTNGFLAAESVVKSRNSP